MVTAPTAAIAIAAAATGRDRIMSAATSAMLALRLDSSTCRNYIAIERGIGMERVDPLPFAVMIAPPAPVAELVDAPDSKSGGGNIVLVQSPARGTSVSCFNTGDLIVGCMNQATKSLLEQVASWPKRIRRSLSNMRAKSRRGAPACTA